jgi:hypothetical protein
VTIGSQIALDLQFRNNRIDGWAVFITCARLNAGMNKLWRSPERQTNR